MSSRDWQARAAYYQSLVEFYSSMAAEGSVDWSFEQLMKEMSEEAHEWLLQEQR